METISKPGAGQPITSCSEANRGEDTRQKVFLSVSSRTQHLVLNGLQHQPRPIYTTPGVLVADATLSVGEIQDLNDQVAAFIKAGVDFFGSEPRFLLRIKVTPKMQPTKEHVEKFSQLLEEVSAELKLQWGR